MTIHDKFNNELHVGNYVCFNQSLGRSKTELIRAKVVALEEEKGSRANWTEGWIEIEVIYPEYLKETSAFRPSTFPKKKAASLCIKCY